MRTLWTIKLHEFNSGNFKVELIDHESGRRAIGRHSTVEQAYRNAECQLIFKPAFFLAGDAVRRVLTDQAVRG